MITQNSHDIERNLAKIESNLTEKSDMTWSPLSRFTMLRHEFMCTTSVTCNTLLVRTGLIWGSCDPCCVHHTFVWWIFRFWPTIVKLLQNRSSIFEMVNHILSKLVLCPSIEISNWCSACYFRKHLEKFGFCFTTFTSERKLRDWWKRFSAFKSFFTVFSSFQALTTVAMQRNDVKNTSDETVTTFLLMRRFGTKKIRHGRPRAFQDFKGRTFQGVWALLG